jgi:hypothetical protein
VKQGQLGASSSFSEEDLASDLIGFYVAKGLVARDGKSDVQIDPQTLRNLVRPVCGAKIKDEDDVEWSLAVFNSYGEFQKVTTWEAPRFRYSCLVSNECGYTRQWPSQYKSIRPEAPTINGKWWWYRGPSVDGELLSTNKAGVFVLWPPQFP